MTHPNNTEMDQPEVNVPSSSGTLIFVKLSQTCQCLRAGYMHCLFLRCMCWNCNRFVLLLVSCSICSEDVCVDTNQCTGLSWDQPYLWHLSVLACMLMCTQMLDLPHCLWCVRCTNYTRCFKTCSDRNLLPEGRMSYSELFLMFFPKYI